MKKGVIITLIIIVIIAVAAAVVVMNQKAVVNQENEGGSASTSIELNTSEDLVSLIDNIYKTNGKPLPSLETREIELTDVSTVNSMTGLESSEQLDLLVVSEPMMSSQAYSFVLAKVKSGVNANDVAKEMYKNINPRKWVCVSAEKVYATNSGDVVCLVMASKDNADLIYNGFKEAVGQQIGEEYSREVAELEDGFDLDPVIPISEL